MDPLPFGQFDLELTNVPLSDDDAVYTCTVESSIDQPDNSDDAVAMITLAVTPLHGKLINTSMLPCSGNETIFKFVT